MSKKQVVLSLIALAIILATAVYYTSRPAGSRATSILKMPKDASIKGCYIARIAKDTFQLAITSAKGTAVEGSLIYNFYEKDDSKGTLTGGYSNGILLAEYTFSSEGITSVRQVIFKKAPDGFIEGFGETKMEGSKEVFKNAAKVSYNGSLIFTRMDECLP
jgi:hypothetical protein